MIPSDPIMLLSVSGEEIEAKLAAVNYRYDVEKNQFV